MLFGKNKKQTSFDLVIDFRSSSIGIAFIEIGGELREPIIHFSKREHIFFQDSPDPNQYISTFEKKLHNILDLFLNITLPKISHNLPKNFKINKIQNFFSSPWYEPKIKNLQIREKNDVVLTHKYLRKVINTENFQKNFLKGSDSEVIENKIISILMNGYEMEDPFGKKANNISIAFYLSELDLDVKGTFYEIIHSLIPDVEIENNTHPLALYTNAKNINPEQKDFLIFDVGGEITEITYVKNYHLEFINSIPFGSHYVIRHVAEKMKNEFHTAWSLIKNYSNDHLGSKIKRKVKSILKEVEDDFIQKAGTAINKNQTEKLPTNYLIISDTEMEKFISNILIDPDFYSKIKSTKKPKVSIINRTRLNISEDPVLKLEANYINLITE